MILILKSLLLPLLLLLTALPVQAEEKSWYEIDGIKFRIGFLSNSTNFRLPSDTDTIIEVNPDFSHLKNSDMFPIAITLPETLMEFASEKIGPLFFRGAVFEFQPKTELKDLVPDPKAPFGETGEISSTTEQFRQNDGLRTKLYNDFFNASDKAFADANSNWALSADVTSSRVFLGYVWGVFIPAGAFIPAFENHRFAKVGAGLGVFYAELSYKLNLCSQYKVTPKLKKDGKVAISGHGGECVGKTEIDSAEANGVGVASILHVTLWERVTKDSIWKIGSGALVQSLTSTADALKLKNHDKNLEVELATQSMEIISYTYRF